MKAAVEGNILYIYTLYSPPPYTTLPPPTPTLCDVVGVPGGCFFSEMTYLDISDMHFADIDMFFVKIWLYVGHICSYMYMYQPSQAD